jgi:RNA polymerase sigma factor (sigma-70 family)
MEYTIDQSVYLSDAELVEGILGGEKKLFERIIRKYNQRLFRIGMSILNSDADVEDAMQITYIKAYEHLATFENNSSIGTWITRIMINECLAQKNKNQRYSNKLPQFENKNSMATPAHALINKELNEILQNAIAQLPEKYRLVFVLREIDEMSVRDTGAALNIEEANVKVRLNRAKSMLRTTLNRYLKENVFAFHLSRCDAMVEKVMERLQIS